jgi:hypothetical protein
MPSNTVYVGRPSKWGNQHSLPKNATDEERQKAVDYYKSYLLYMTAPHSLESDFLKELRGKNLACWCPLDKPCHADVLLRFANNNI